jgi:hypothetical protein
MTTSEMTDKFVNPAEGCCTTYDGEPLTVQVTLKATVAVDYLDADQNPGDIVIGDPGSVLSTSPITTTLKSPVAFSVRITLRQQKCLFVVKKFP